jgi:hypothetical protein
VVDDILILGVIREVGAIIEVMAVKQAAGCAVRRERARLTQVEGTWHLRWGAIPAQRSRSKRGSPRGASPGTLSEKEAQP